MNASTERNSSTPIPGSRGWIVITLTSLMAITNLASTRAQPSEKQQGKVLFAVTSHDKKGDTGEPTGFYLSEVAHPWEVLVNAGYEIDFVSPKGGKAPADGFDLTDPINRKFWEDKVYREKIEHTKKPSEVDPREYAGIHFAGGHGTMWDFPDNVTLSKIAATIYENNGIVSAVCHGPAGLVNLKLSNGKYLIQGKKMNAFTNEEEAAVKLDKVVPFLLESKLIERGAIFEKSAPFQSHAVADQRVVTGQNPQSATAVGKAMLEELKHIAVVGRLTRYSVKPVSEDAFRKALADYVTQARDEEGNIQAEAFSEQDKTTILWLIERWKDRNELQRFDGSAQAKAIDALMSEALDAKEETYHVKDLEPLSKEQWRRVPRAEDQPLTVMLFVDSKPGTQQAFMDTYHVAMPPFRSQPGVVTYQLSRVQGEDTKFVTFEKFRSKDAFQRHLDFPPIKPVLTYLETSIQKQPFQAGLHLLVEFAPAERE